MVTFAADKAASFETANECTMYMRFLCPDYNEVCRGATICSHVESSSQKTFVFDFAVAALIFGVYFLLS